jgi:hypothetical protein
MKLGLRWPEWRLPDRVGWRDHVIGAALGLAYVLWLVATARSLGFPRDEGVYFHAGESYVRWWRLLLTTPHEALKPNVIDGAWSFNSEHPPLMKTLFGVSWWFFHEQLHIFQDASTAFRLPGMASAGLALWVTYLFGARAYGRVAGLVGAILLGLMPRVFFHAHLACFDVPITAMWILCVYIHWRAQAEGGYLWAIATGVVFGLALATKHNAWMLPVVCIPHALCVHREAIGKGLRSGQIVIPSSLVMMALLGPLVMYALWPHLWNDPLGRVQAYMQFHLNHEYYNIEFLGRNYFSPPSPKAYLPVMVVATVPSVTLVLAAMGIGERAKLGALRAWSWTRSWVAPAAEERPKADAAQTDLLLALSLLVAIGPFFLPKTPIFGGTKHWMPAYPVLAIFAGHGFALIRRRAHRVLEPRIGKRVWRVAAEVALTLSILLAPLLTTAHSHPFGLSAYVPLVGGTAGGADLGLNRQFWGFTSQTAAAEYLNAHAPRGSVVFIHDTTWDAWSRMQQEGRVRSDLRAAFAPGEADFVLVEHELHMNEVDYSAWVGIGTDAPTYVVQHDGVPIVSIYKRR